MFYEYIQNNSGGSFDFDISRGITHIVIIEADNYMEANSKAEDIGLYFDGSGDCQCCGNRWDEVHDEDEATKEPMYCGEPIEAIKDCKYKWMDDGHEAAVHYINGDIKWY
jgi:hypothetical protein